MSKVIWVFGPQHSGTRLFTCLIDRHPDVKGVLHQSFPAGKHQMYDNFSTEEQYDLEKCDFLLIVNREDEFVNKSNIMKNHGPIAEKAKIHINKELENIEIIDNDFYKNKIIRVSYEQLVSQKGTYIKKVLDRIGLDSNKYNFNLDGKKYIPNNIFGKPNANALVRMSIIDGNAKYR